MNKTALIATLFLISASFLLFYQTQNNQDEYLTWKKSFGYSWSVEEDDYRKIIFNKNVEIINKHNADPSKTYKMGVNQFTGLTDQEFAKLYLSPRINPNLEKNHDTVIIPINAQIDWDHKKMVSPVKDQGFCGSCWAFGAVGVLESWALMKKQKTILSEQQLVDCSYLYGNLGCNGGLHYRALAYVADHGITTEQLYPYVGKDQICKVLGGAFKITKVNNVQGCTELQNAIMERPVAVAVDATNWVKYHSGIFSDCDRNLNHDVLLVGKMFESWKIKNSWGVRWGEEGFIRIKLGNTCGICDDKISWVE